MLVVAAAIVRAGQVLAAQRSYPAGLAGSWEFPGGKVEAGESPRDALAREIREELAVEVAVHERLGADVALTPATAALRGSLRLYRCSLTSPDERPLASDHNALRWLDAAELDALPWLPSNRQLLPGVRGILFEVKR